MAHHREQNSGDLLESLENKGTTTPPSQEAKREAIAALEAKAPEQSNASPTRGGKVSKNRLPKTMPGIFLAG